MKSTTTNETQRTTASRGAHTPRETTDEHRRLADAILKIVFAQRRLLPSAAQETASFADEAAPHRAKLLRAVARDEPVTLVLPAFPAKSPNRQKTLSHLPDLGDKAALRVLHELCARIQRIYAPGAQLVLCSDGRVFADLVRIPDADVTEYGRVLREFAEAELGGGVAFFDLDDVYADVDDFESLREELLIGYGEPLRALRRRTKEDDGASAMYRGITRFLFEDFVGLPEFEGMSRTAVQKQARRYAYRVIQRSNAWSRLLADRFADALRLSIHPQPRVSEKIGVSLLDSDDVWRTPWHSVAVWTEQGLQLMPRHVAEKMNLSLVFVDGRPSHYEARAAIAA